MKESVKKSYTIVLTINLLGTSILFLFLTYLKYVVGGFVRWELIKWSYILFVSCVVTEVTRDLKIWNLLMIFLLIGTIIGNELGTYYWYNYVSGDFATPAVGMLLEIICAIIILIFMITVNVIVLIKNKDNK